MAPGILMKQAKMMAIIPARGGSKGLPRKNLRPLGGIPLIAWTIKAAKESQLIDFVVVTSDDPEILDIAQQFGADHLISRPKFLASDNATTIQVVDHVFELLPPPKTFVLLQPTSPLRSSAVLNHAIDFFIENNALSLVSVTESSESPYWTFLIQNQSLVPVIPTLKMPNLRQQIPKTFVLNGAIYISDTQLFLKIRKFVSEYSLPYIMEKQISIDIDSLEDFEAASIILERQQLDNQIEKYQ
jgi:CMP-N-acetylneuraminic acid synthetase